MSSLKEILMQRKKARQTHQKYVSEEQLLSLVNQLGIQNILHKLNIQYKSTKGGIYCGFCPDHYQHCGRVPDKPKWYCFENGKTFCHTERRSSNIVSIAKTLMGLKTDRQALEKLLNGQQLILVQRTILQPQKKIKTESEQLKQKKQMALKTITKILDEGNLTQQCIDYFQRDGINIQTLKKFGICSCTYGKYKQRAIIPFFNKEWQLIGFNAVDYLGKQEWVNRRYDEYIKINGLGNQVKIKEQLNKRYKKVLFCPGFKSSEHLYGYYENLSYREGIDYLVLVQGERDCLKLMQSGIPCVALHGVNLSKDQTLMIQGISYKQVFLGFDMDQAGNEACNVCKEILNDKIQKIYVLNFESGKDPKKHTRQQLLYNIQYSRRNNINERKCIV